MRLHHCVYIITLKIQLRAWTENETGFLSKTTVLDQQDRHF
jgi:hypothetical protein